MANTPQTADEATLQQAAQAAGLNVEAVRTSVEAVLAEPLYWFPVRHHSPAVARHLDAVLRARKPKVVFIEGPAEANDLVQHVVDARTKPPVAIYSSYRDDDNVLGLAGIASPAEDVPARFACWYPLLAYSPEYVAMLAARKVGAKVVLMDLPHHALIRPAPRGEQPAPPPVEHESEQLLAESGFYHKLAEVAGYRSWPEAWDSLFEVQAFAGAEEFRRELATFCAAARATTPPQRIRTDGTLERERFMWQTIRTTLAKKKLAPEQALVVCGGFHLFLDRNDPEPPPAPPAGSVYTTVVPYSFFRVSELSGYAAGNRAPQFYQTAWELAVEGRGPDVLVEHVVAVLKEARRAGEVVSSADAIAVSQHAEMLARLRGRPAPVLDDIHDALITCCCKGSPQDDGVHLLRAMDAAGIGNRLGKATPALGRLPIVNDFHAQMSDLDLGNVLEREQKISVVLDKREPLAGRRSAFLHRLLFLTVPLAALDEAPAGDFATGTIFREKWSLRWGPNVEPALIEQNLYGDSVEAAALARLREDLAKDAGHAGKTTQRLVEAVDMDLPDLVPRAEEACGRAIDTDARFVSLCQALGHLNVIERYAAIRHLRREEIEDLITRCFDRACFALPGVASVPEEQQAEVVGALQGLAEAVLRGRMELDRALFVENVRQSAKESPVPFLRGAFLGMLAELRDIPAEDLAAELSALARAPAERMVTAGDFLDGILAVSRTSIMLGADALVKALDELLRAADWEAFLVMLPRLRAAFERLHEQQRGSVAARVAAHYGLAQEEELLELGASVGAAARLARIDQQVARIMEQWEAFMSDEHTLARWRLVLGKSAEEHGVNCAGDGACQRIEQLVGFLFHEEGQGSGGRGQRSKGREGGRGPSTLTVPEWVDQVSELFPRQAKEILERELVQRRGIAELLEKPELLEKIEPNVELVKTLLTHKDLLNPKTRVLARKIIDKVVQELRDKLKVQVETAITGAIRRDRHSPRRVYRNLDLNTTLRRNLKNFDAESGKLLVDRLFFFAAERKKRPWHVLVVVDQSGSMLDSAIFSAIMASIFAELPSMRTSLVLFDTNVVDLSDQVGQPVDVLLSIQLGGGTDITKALQYTAGLVREPARSIVVLITDFFEGRDERDLVKQVKTMAEAGVRMVGLGALGYDARPAYNKTTAGKLRKVGMDILVCTPEQLAQCMAQIIRG